MYPHSHNDWGQPHPAERVGRGPGDGFQHPLEVCLAIFAFILVTAWAVVMMRRQMRDWREQREKRERTERMNSKPDDD